MEPNQRPNVFLFASLLGGSAYDPQYAHGYYGDPYRGQAPYYYNAMSSTAPEDGSSTFGERIAGSAQDQRAANENNYNT